MGRRKTDGLAINMTVPDATAVADYELYRIGGINGLAITDVAADDVERTIAFETDTNAIYSIHAPSGVNPAAGALLYWTTPGSFQDCSLHLRTTPATQGDSPCFFVTKARSADPDGGFVLEGRVLNGVTGDSIGTS